MTEVARSIGRPGPRRVGEDQPDDVPHSRRRRYLIAAGVAVVLAGAGIGAGLALSSSKARTVQIDDRFERTSDVLGSVDGHQWEVVSGAFGVDGDEAAVTEHNDAGPRTIAVIDVGATNATITATAGSIGRGWGVVFRYIGPFNYWYVQAVPDFAVLNVVSVVNGKATTVGRTAATKIEDGMEVTIVLTGPTVEVRLGDDPIFATTSGHGLGARKAGLIVVGDGEATWQRFRAEADRANPGPEEIQVGASGGGTPSVLPGGADG